MSAWNTILIAHWPIIDKNAVSSSENSIHMCTPKYWYLLTSQRELLNRWKAKTNTKIKWFSFLFWQNTFVLICDCLWGLNLDLSEREVKSKSFLYKTHSKLRIWTENKLHFSLNVFLLSEEKQFPLKLIWDEVIKFWLSNFVRIHWGYVWIANTSVEASVELSPYI